MKKTLYFAFICLLLSACSTSDVNKQTEASMNANYLQNRAPLKTKPYLELPLGAIRPHSWLLDQLHRMQTGMTGHLDEIYPEVVGQRNGWLGGDGDGWERGPYWIDGLLPLAYILDDQDLKNKVQPWIEWSLNNQMEDGYLGPIPFESEPEPEEGLQKDRRRDWWPKMVMLKVLQQYYSATGDERVIETLTNYFRYQLKELPERPLDYLSFWGNRRGGDNLQVVYWLYNITGDDFLLELGELIAEQTFPWKDVFLNEENYEQPMPWSFSSMKGYPFDQAEIDALTVSQWGGIHCVNFAQGLKQPVVYYQQSQDEQYLLAAKKALKDIKKYHGQPQGMYGGDEPLHGTDPVRGVEFCSVTESMFSLETMLSISGDMEFADLLEKITYNALPAQASDDFSSRQYFQAANQVQLNDAMQSSYQTQGHQGTDFVFGTLTGYPCCTCNMHQSWPKFVQNLWYATADGGVAALLYGPSEVELKVANGTELKITESTGFPFREEVNFELELNEESSFPFHLRIPSWTENPIITINGETWKGTIENQLAIINRTWKNGDVVKLTLPMPLKSSLWHDFAVAIERGPLVYALKIQAEEREKDRNDKYRSFTEVYPIDDWNFALVQSDLANLSESVKVVYHDWDGAYPWNLDNAPVSLEMRGIQIPEWKAVNGNPVFPAFWGGQRKEKSDPQKISLVPYGCTTLRITEFPAYAIE